MWERDPNTPQTVCPCSPRFAAHPHPRQVLYSKLSELSCQDLAGTIWSQAVTGQYHHEVRCASRGHNCLMMDEGCACFTEDATGGDRRTALLVAACYTLRRAGATEQS